MTTKQTITVYVPEDKFRIHLEERTPIPLDEFTGLDPETLDLEQQFGTCVVIARTPNHASNEWVEEIAIFPNYNENDDSAWEFYQQVPQRLSFHAGVVEWLHFELPNWVDQTKAVEWVLSFQDEWHTRQIEGHRTTVEAL